MRTSYTLKLFGTFALHQPDGQRIPISSKKAIALLAMLAMADDGWRMRAWLQDMLWGSRGIKQAQASLRREISNLRQALGVDCELLSISPDKLRLNLNVARIDARSDQHANQSMLVRGDFLEGLDIVDADGFNDWLSAQRAALQPLESVDQSFGVTSRKRQDASSSERLNAQPVRPPIAITPFNFMPAREENLSLAKGVSEHLFSVLSQFSTISTAWSGLELGNDGSFSSLQTAEHCSRLGVRYLVAGVIDVYGEKVRVSARLLAHESAAPIWAARFEEKFDDIFLLQDRIANHIAPQIDSAVERHERKRAVAVPINPADACQLYWRANAAFRVWTKDGVTAAINLAENASLIEPNNAWISSLTAFCHGAAYGLQWSDHPEESRQAAQRHLERSLANGSDDAFVLGYGAGTLLMIGGDKVVAERFIARALEIHPTASATIFWGAWIDLWLGNTRRARGRFETILHINPSSAVRPFSLSGLGVCLLAEGENDEAVAYFKEALHFIPTHPLTLAGLAIVYGKIGDVEQSVKYAASLQQLGGIQTVLQFFSDPNQRASFLVEQF